MRMTGVSMYARLLQKLDVTGSRCSSYSRKGTGMFAKENLHVQRNRVRSVKLASVPEQISGNPSGTPGKSTFAATTHLAASTQMASGLLANGLVRCGAKPRRQLSLHEQLTEWQCFSS